MKELPQARLKELCTYIPETGIFTYNHTNKAKGQVAGREAGGLTSGRVTYKAIKIDGITYKSHRLAFLYIEGDLPDIVDHKDGDTINNIFTNLRKASVMTNRWNSKLPSTNSSGVKGVCLKHNGWSCRVQANGKVHSKFFYCNIDNEKEREEVLALAADYVKVLRTTLHGEFTNHG